MTRPLAVAATALALGLAPTASLADALTDRALAASETMMGMMTGLLEQCAPGLRGQLGDGSLTPAMADAAACQVTAMRDRLGRAEATRYVEALESYAGRDFADFAAFINAADDYPSLDNDLLLELSRECGAVEASMSGPITQAMQSNPAALTPCFGG